LVLIKLSKEIEECYAEREVLNNELTSANEALMREGGDLFKNREELKAKQEFLNREVIRKRTELVELASSTFNIIFYCPWEGK
jgi:hypothetical protein